MRFLGRQDANPSKFFNLWSGEGEAILEFRRPRES